MKAGTFLSAGAALIWAAPSFCGEVAPGEVPLDAPVVVMGEEHDAPAHHAHQADWVTRQAPRAVVFEMLSPDLAEVAMARRDAPVAELGAALSWEGRGWPDFEAYHPIFEALGEALILGAEVPRADLARAAEEGAASVRRDATALGLDRPLPAAEQAAREAEQAAAHCDLLPRTALPGMVEAQRLRDAALAAAVLEGLDRTGGPVAVITGNGHARRDRGVPALLSVARPDLEVIALGQFTEARETAPFDAWVVTEMPEERPADPCAALR